MGMSQCPSIGAVTSGQYVFLIIHFIQGCILYTLFLSQDSNIRIFIVAMYSDFARLLFCEVSELSVNPECLHVRQSGCILRHTNVGCFPQSTCSSPMAGMRRDGGRKGPLLVTTTVHQKT